VTDLAAQDRRRFRRTTWREGTSERLSARFALQRVIPFHDDGIDPSVREDVWLLMEWEDGESKPTKFYFINLPPARRSRKRIVRIAICRFLVKWLPRCPACHRRKPLRRSRRRRAAPVTANTGLTQ